MFKQRLSLFWAILTGTMAISLTAYLAQMGEVWGGHGCGAYGLLKSREMEEKQEALPIESE